MEQPAEETIWLLREYYLYNIEPLLSVLAEDCCWISPAEQIFFGKDAILTQFSGGIVSPVCHMKDMQFRTLDRTTDRITVCGDYCAYTDIASGMVLAVQQRITFCYRREQEGWKLYHMHVSNAWNELTEGEVFPDQISKQTYAYLQECITAQKKQIEEQTALLERLSFEDSLTGLYNRNKFNQSVEQYKNTSVSQLGVACFDLNGLKPVNDQLGHTAGDRMICRTAHHIQKIFYGKAYRIGGDEFVVIEDGLTEQEFYDAIVSVRTYMKEEDISVSIGVSWRFEGCNIVEQFEEADLLMYQEKEQFYGIQKNDRRKK